MIFELLCFFVAKFGLQIRETRRSTAAECRLLIRGEIFAGIDKLIPFEVVLFVVKLTVAPVGCEQVFMRATLDNLARFQHEDLVRTANG